MGLAASDPIDETPLAASPLMANVQTSRRLATSRDEIVEFSATRVFARSAFGYGHDPDGVGAAADAGRTESAVIVTPTANAVAARRPAPPGVMSVDDDAGSPEQFGGDVHPHLRGQPEGLDVHPLVVAVEAARERFEGDRGAEQAEAVGDGPLAPEEPGVGAAGGQPRDEARLRVGPPGDPLEQVAQRGLPWGRRGRRLVDDLDLHLVREGAE